MHIIGKLFNWPRLLCCFCQSGRCISWTCALNFKSLLMVYVTLLCCFALYCLSFGSRSKHHNHCSIHLKSESVTGQLALKLVVMTKLLGSSRTVVLELRAKVFVNTILKHSLQTMFMKTVRILRTGLKWRFFMWLSNWNSVVNISNAATVDFAQCQYQN